MGRPSTIRHTAFIVLPPPLPPGALPLLGSMRLVCIDFLTEYHKRVAMSIADFEKSGRICIVNEITLHSNRDIGQKVGGGDDIRRAKGDWADAVVGR